MFAEHPDCFSMLGIGIAVCEADDDGDEPSVLAPAGWEHRRGQRVAFAVPERQKQGHLALDMRLQPNFLFKEDLGCRLIGLGRLVFRTAEILCDCVAHQAGFISGLGLEPKPSLPTWGVTNVSHAPSALPSWGRKPCCASATFSTPVTGD